MTRKALAIEAYLAGHSSRAAARIAGLSERGSYVRRLIQEAGISRPVGRPRRAA
jgi:transposase